MRSEQSTNTVTEASYEEMRIEITTQECLNETAASCTANPRDNIAVENATVLHTVSSRPLCNQSTAPPFAHNRPHDMTHNIRNITLFI